MNKKLLIAVLISILFIYNSNAQKGMNVVFILSDDQRFNTIHALGNKDIITPNLDRLLQWAQHLQEHILWAEGRVLSVCPAV